MSIWSICGPTDRARLDIGDVLFFLPQKTYLKQLKLNHYICTGIIVVEKILNGVKELKKEKGVFNEFVLNYQKDLKAHLRNDKPSIKRIRPKNIVLGSRKKSIWFGGKYHNIEKNLSTWSFSLSLNDLGKRRVPTLDENDTKKLYYRMTGKKL